MNKSRLLLVIALILCVAFVAETHSHSHSHGHGHSHSHSHSTSQAPKVQTTVNDLDFISRIKSSSWLKPIIATILISLAPIPILFLIPIQTGKQSKLLNVLLSFAVGGLLGDVFLHLLPHSVPHHEAHDESEHNHTGEMHVGLWVLAGIASSGHSHSHSHSHKEKDEDSSSIREQDSQTLRQRKPSDNKPSSQPDSKADKPAHQEPIAVSGWLNLVADFSHNFTDGLAIGASFLAGEKLGYITTLAILFHEIPHEIGDFAILVQSGFSKKNAILAQFSTAIGAVIGTVIGLLAEGIGETTLWILPFTAGGFIYIATVTVIPILLEDTSFKQSAKEILALCFGVALMYLVALYE